MPLPQQPQLLLSASLGIERPALFGKIRALPQEEQPAQDRSRQGSVTGQSPIRQSPRHQPSVTAESLSRPQPAPLAAAAAASAAQAGPASDGAGRGRRGPPVAGSADARGHPDPVAAALRALDGMAGESAAADRSWLGGDWSDSTLDQHHDGAWGVGALWRGVATGGASGGASGGAAGGTGRSRSGGVAAIGRSSRAALKPDSGSDDANAGNAASCDAPGRGNGLPFAVRRASHPRVTFESYAEAAAATSTPASAAAGSTLHGPAANSSAACGQADSTSAGDGADETPPRRALSRQASPTGVAVSPVVAGAAGAAHGESQGLAEPDAKPDTQPSAGLAAGDREARTGASAEPAGEGATSTKDETAEAEDEGQEAEEWSALLRLAQGSARDLQRSGSSTDATMKSAAGSGARPAGGQPCEAWGDGRACQSARQAGPEASGAAAAGLSWGLLATSDDVALSSGSLRDQDVSAGRAASRPAVDRPGRLVRSGTGWQLRSAADAKPAPLPPRELRAHLRAWEAEATAAAAWAASGPRAVQILAAAAARAQADHARRADRSHEQVPKDCTPEGPGLPEGGAAHSAAGPLPFDAAAVRSLLRRALSAWESSKAGARRRCDVIQRVGRMLGVEDVLGLQGPSRWIDDGSLVLPAALGRHARHHGASRVPVESGTAVAPDREPSVAAAGDWSPSSAGSASSAADGSESLPQDRLTRAAMALSREASAAEADAGADAALLRLVERREDAKRTLRLLARQAQRHAAALAAHARAVAAGGKSGRAAVGHRSARADAALGVAALPTRRQRPRADRALMLEGSARATAPLARAWRGGAPAAAGRGAGVAPRAKRGSGAGAPDAAGGSTSRLPRAARQAPTRHDRDITSDLSVDSAAELDGLSDWPPGTGHRGLQASAQGSRSGSAGGGSPSGGGVVVDVLLVDHATAAPPVTPVRGTGASAAHRKPVAHASRRWATGRQVTLIDAGPGVAAVDLLSPGDPTAPASGSRAGLSSGVGGAPGKRAPEAQAASRTRAAQTPDPVGAGAGTGAGSGAGAGAPRGRAWGDASLGEQEGAAGDQEEASTGSSWLLAPPPGRPNQLTRQLIRDLGGELSDAEALAIDEATAAAGGDMRAGELSDSESLAALTATLARPPGASEAGTLAQGGLHSASPAVTASVTAATVSARDRCLELYRRLTGELVPRLAAFELRTGRPLRWRGIHYARCIRAEVALELAREDAAIRRRARRAL